MDRCSELGVRLKETQPRILCNPLLPSSVVAVVDVHDSLSALNMSGLQAVLTNPAYHDYLGVLKGARNGFVYGVKVRFPHALIMAILFGRGEYVHFHWTGISLNTNSASAVGRRV